jgi:hypothetical protein
MARERLKREEARKGQKSLDDALRAINIYPRSKVDTLWKATEVIQKVSKAGKDDQSIAK